LIPIFTDSCKDDDILLIPTFTDNILLIPIFTDSYKDDNILLIPTFTDHLLLIRIGDAIH